MEAGGLLARLRRRRRRQVLDGGERLPRRDRLGGVAAGLGRDVVRRRFLGLTFFLDLRLLELLRDAVERLLLLGLLQRAARDASSS